MSRANSDHSSPQPSSKLRRRMGIGGLSLIATTSLLGTYVGYPGLRRAYAATTCTVTSNGDDRSPSQAGQLRYCLEQVNNGGPSSITFTPGIGSIALSDNLPATTLTGPLRIIGASTGDTVIDGSNSSGPNFSAFRFAGPYQVSLSDITVQDTFSIYYGAGLHAAGDVTITNSVFSSNSSDNSTGSGGGAIDVGGDVTITDSTFTLNSTRKDGGAVNAYGDVTITYSTFHDNTATGYGGAVRTFYSANISNSTFSENTAYVGGAISGAYPHAYGAHLNISNSTLTGNEADYNAAIYWRNNASMNFVTLTDNGTSSSYFGTYIAGDLSLANSIMFGNINGASSAKDLEVGGVLTVSHSLFTSISSFTALNGQTTTNVIYGDPRLGSLANNGGPTLTMMPAADSPVLTMANPSGAPMFDQRGFTRTTQGQADMGAVERRGRPPAGDPSQMPPAWFQATTRTEQSAECPANMHPSWAQWPNDHTGGWTCEWSTWWDINKGTQGGWVTTPGFNPGRTVS